MRFKLDENADPRWRMPLETDGHTVSTVLEERLQGTDDHILAETCKEHGLVLITVDVGFARILEYPPEEYPGIIVLRHPAPTLRGMTRLISQVVSGLRNRSPAGRLWIVEPGRIRIHGIRGDQDTVTP
ncbi:MAG: DUF5615 family PIN-like protein [Thermodesulfobacteriota bacterium]